MWDREKWRTAKKNSLAYKTYIGNNRIASAASQADLGTHCWGQRCRYDADNWNNLTIINVTKCTAPLLSLSVNSLNRITNSGFTYNAAGDETADGTLTFTWNAEERLTATAGVNYTYDGDGWRVKKDQTSGSTYDKLQWRSPSGEILVETDLAGANPIEYIYFAGRRVARRHYLGTIQYFLQDHLGSTRIIANASGSIVRESDYYPFGGERVVGTPTVDDPHKFAGMYRDGESGLYHTWARMYSPELGRWLAPDFLGGETTDPNSLNRYAYVGNNPVNFVDPLGLCNNEVVTSPVLGVSSTTVTPCWSWSEFWAWRTVWVSYTPPGEGGGTGGGGGGGLGNPKKAGKSEAETALNNSDDCARALGARSSAEAIKALEGLKYKWANLSTIEGVSTPWGMGTESFVAADYNYRTGVVRLNQNIGGDPSNVTPGKIHGLLGKAGPVNLNSGTERIWNLRSGSVTNGVFWAIMKLHELGHALGGLPYDRNKPELNKQNTTTVIDNCFGSLKNE